jgi:hypothetical protein
MEFLADPQPGQPVQAVPGAGLRVPTARDDYRAEFGHGESTSRK